MEGKFTPGPWTAYENGAIYGPTVPYGKGFTIKLAQTVHPDKNENAANAALIAAAPAMLEALTLALAALEATLEADDPEACTQMEWEQEPLPTIRAAIAQARKVRP